MIDISTKFDIAKSQNCTASGAEFFLMFRDVCRVSPSPHEQMLELIRSQEHTLVQSSTAHDDHREAGGGEDAEDYCT